MANRDKSQNVAFAYTNIYQLYKKAKESSAAPLSSDARIWKAEELEGAKITKFEPRTLAAQETAKKVVASGPAGENPFDDLKSNLKRLEDLHARLRFMLRELEDLVNKKD